jgi:hypothetical protein
MQLVKDAKDAEPRDWLTYDNLTIARNDDFNLVSVDDNYKIDMTFKHNSRENSVSDVESAINFTSTGMRVVE